MIACRHFQADREYRFVYLGLEVRLQTYSFLKFEWYHCYVASIPF